VKNYTKKDAVRSGGTFGSALAIAISYTTHQSVLWAIIHGFFSWFYVVYFALGVFALGVLLFVFAIYVMILWDDI